MSLNVCVVTDVYKLMYLNAKGSEIQNRCQQPLQFEDTFEFAIPNYGQKVFKVQYLTIAHARTQAANTAYACLKTSSSHLTAVDPNYKKPHKH